jgi:site-specific DNA-methyltransferase (adenine-specific)
MITRQKEFDSIAKAIRSELRFSTEGALVAEGDSLASLRSMPSHCVSLILTDPPYHATKKQNIYGDAAFEEDQHYLEWMEQYAVEWRRVLRPNGSLFCFCDSSMSARLEVMFANRFNVLSHVVWTKPNDPGFDGWKGKMKKEALRQWYPHSERIIFAEPAVEGNLHRSPFAQFLREARKQSGLTAHQLAEITGAYGTVNHGGAISNWETGRNIPSREQYRKICEAIIETGNVDAMPAYEDAIRIFRMDASKEFTDVWTFPSVRPYKGKHPAEKPAAMLEHAIEATTFPGDIVLDCFAGSGSTALAALSLKRRVVAIEIEPQWVQAIGARLEADAVKQGKKSVVETTSKRQSPQPQLGLFAGAK